MQREGSSTFGSTVGMGYRCSICHQFVSWGNSHYCTGATPYPYQPPAPARPMPPDHTHVFSRIAAALERIAQALEQRR